MTDFISQDVIKNSNAPTRKSCKTLTHDTLVQLVQIFVTTMPNAGVCEGFISMWIQALLTGKKEEAFFYQRLDAISDYLKNNTPETLKKEIDAIYLSRLNQSSKLSLSEDSIQKTEIRAFFEAVAIQQEPITIDCGDFSQFDKQYLYPLTYSQKLEQQKTILHTTCLGVLTPTRNELADYLTNLQSMIIAKKTAAPIAFFLRSDNHSTGFYFDKDSNLWHYLDINQLNKKETYYTATSSTYLANLIFDSFQDIGDYSSFSIAGIYTDTNDCATMSQLNTITLATLNLSIPHDRKNSLGCTALWLACYAGNQPIVDLLLQKGAISSINTKNNNGISPLYVACYNGHRAVVALLLEKGAINSVNTPNNNGSTPLYITCQNGHQAVASLLLQKGAISSVNTKNNNDFTPLLVACLNGYQAIVALLLENGGITSINTPCNGITPLYIACENGHQTVVALLLEKGAIANTPCHGFNPLCIARQQGHQGIVALLLEKGAIATNIHTSRNSFSPLYNDHNSGNNAQQKRLRDKTPDNKEQAEQEKPKPAPEAKRRKT